MRRQAWGIIALISVFLAFQVFMIVRGHFVPNKHFAFWMFPESTYFTASLLRETIDGKQVKTDKGGTWTVPTDNGRLTYRWTRFVDGFRMDQLDSRVRSKGVFDETVEYYQSALNYVAARIPEDKTTQKLVLRIQYQRASGPKEVMTLESAPRLGSASGLASTPRLEAAQ